VNFKELLKQCAATAYPEPHSEVHAQITPWVVDEVAKRLKPGDTVLDVGCGNGLCARLMRDKGLVVTCVSVLQSEVDKARADGFDVILSEMHGLHDAGKHHCVFARHVLEHSPCPFYMLKLLKELLLDGGLLYVEVPAPDTENHHELNPNHWSCLTGSMWGQLIQRAGFKVEQTSLKFETGAGKDEYICFICHA
jgi:2-polyprenyl-3-methyl-5-hydroxy-6-metoxy-1,4-benzoquinol methylase